MKLINKYNAVLILLLHSFLIPIGMIAAYFIPSTEEDPTIYFKFPLYDLKEQSHSTAELQSWLNFLESPHEETFVGKETISETLDKNEALGALKFFSNVAEGDHVDYLADRISAREDEGHPYLWRITLQGASDEEASTLFNALTTVIKRKFLDQVAAYDTPIDILPLLRSEVPQDRSVRFGKACVPAVGALLAAILVVIAWSLCMPSQRKLPFASSTSLLLVCTFALSFVGAGIGYLFTANSYGEWESEMLVEVRRTEFLTVDNLTSEAQSLKAKLDEKLEIKSHFGCKKDRSRNTNNGLVKRLVDQKKMMTWSSFQPIAKARGFEPDDSGAENLDRLGDYIMDRFEIEQDPDAGNIYTLRFRCEDPTDSRCFLACFVDDYSAILDRNSGMGPLTLKYEINRSNTEIKKLRWPGIASGNTFQGALLGAVFSLVIVSSTRVLAGAPTI